jgi:hypothetical protein
MSLRPGPSRLRIIFGGLHSCPLSARVFGGSPSSFYIYFLCFTLARSGFDVYSAKSPFVWVYGASSAWWWVQSFEVLRLGVRC